MGIEEDRAGGESQVYDTLVKLLSTPEAHRKSEDVFEIANGLLRASFFQQLDVCTRAKIARYAKLYEIVPGALITFHEKGDNALYIVLSGSVRVEAAGLEFLSGDTLGFRPPASPTFQIMADLRVVTCSKEGVAAKVDFDDCVKIWPELGDDVSDDDGYTQDRPAAMMDVELPSSSLDLVWSPELAKSLLLRGAAKGEEVPVALEFLNFPPVNGYSKELRKMLVSHFVMLRGERGHVFCKWFNPLPINPGDVRLSRVHLDSVFIVVSGSLVVTCRRRGDHQAEDASAGSGVLSETIAGDRAVLPKVRKKQGANTVEDEGAGLNNVKDIRKNTGDERGGQLVLMRLKAGDVFPPKSGQMQGGRQRRDESVFDQQEGKGDWVDYTLCSLTVESQSAAILRVDANVFNDVIYPGTDLRYGMERVRDILGTPPGLRTWKDIRYIARNVLSHHVAFQQMSTLSLERIASRLANIIAAPGGQVLVEHGQSVDFSMVLLRGSASIIAVCKSLRLQRVPSEQAKSRSKIRRMKVGRLEPGDLWGMQHMQAGANADVEIMAVENCEVIRVLAGEVRAAEKRDLSYSPASSRAVRSLVIPPERRTRRDVRNIVAEMSAHKSGLDIARFRRIPLCLKTRLAAALRLEVWPPFRELTRDVDSAGTYFVIVKGSISLQTMPKSKRFHLETLDIPGKGSLKTLDVDNTLALEGWRASGLGPCAGMLFERQIMGEYPHAKEVVPSARAVTREETTAALVDIELYARGMSRVNPTDKHAVVCHKVLCQLKRHPEKKNRGSVGSLESDLLLRLLKANPALKRLSTTCLLRLSGALTLARYTPGEVVTEAKDYDDSLFIILEGRLEYFVQDIIRGVIDRALTKEVGMVPGLLCVGVMTSGDFFAPDSILGRGGKRERVVQAGSYRIRCSPDSSPDGAMCLILPRKKLEDAVRRDRTASSALVFYQKAPLGLADRCPGDQARLQKTEFPLHMVNFGGPEPREESRHHTTGNSDKRGEKRAPESMHPTTPPATIDPGIGPDRCGEEGISAGVMQSASQGYSRRQCSACPAVESLHSLSSLEQGAMVTVTAAEANAAAELPAARWTAVVNGENLGRDRGHPEATSVTDCTTVGEVGAGVVEIVLADAGRKGRQQAFMTAFSSPVALGLDGNVPGASSPIHAVTSASAIDDPRHVEGVAVEHIVGDADAGYGMRAATPGEEALSEAFSPVDDGKRPRSIAQTVGQDVSTAKTTADLGRGLETSSSAGPRCHSTFSSSCEGKIWTSVVRGGEGVETEPRRLHNWTGVGGDWNLLDALTSFVSTHFDSYKRTSMAGNFADGDLNTLANVPHFPGAPGRQGWEKKKEAMHNLRPTPLCCHQRLPPVTLGETSLAGATLASLRQTITRAGREARVAIIQRLAISAARDIAYLKRRPQSRQREASSAPIGHHTAAIVKIGDGAGSAIAVRGGESRSQSVWAQHRRDSGRQTADSDPREDLEDDRRPRRRYFHQCGVDGTRIAMDTCRESSIQPNIIFPHQPSAHSPYAKTPRLKNAGGGTRGGNIDRPRSEPVDRDDEGQRGIVARNVSNADENPTTIGNPPDNTDRRHRMTKGTNEHECNRLSERLRVRVAGGGSAMAIRHSQERVSRRQGSAAASSDDAPQDRSPRRPYQAVPSHGGQTTKRVYLAPFDDTLASTYSTKTSSVNSVDRDAPSLRGSPESAERGADLWSYCGEGRKYETRRTMGTVPTKIQHGKETDTYAAGGDGSIAVLRVRGSPPKQPVVVRHLKMTLQQLNGL